MVRPEEFTLYQQYRHIFTYNPIKFFKCPYKCPYKNIT
nr:MAG TPA: hypothetical protein [Caudoviricetes sp.]